MASTDLQAQLFSTGLLLSTAGPAPTAADVAAHWRALSAAPGAAPSAAGGRPRPRRLWGPGPPRTAAPPPPPDGRCMAPPSAQEVEEFEQLRRLSRPAPLPARSKPTPLPSGPAVVRPTPGPACQAPQNGSAAPAPKSGVPAATAARPPPTRKRARPTGGETPNADPLPGQREASGAAAPETLGATGSGEARPPPPEKKAEKKKRTRAKKEKRKDPPPGDADGSAEPHADADSAPGTAAAPAAAKPRTWGDTLALRRERNRRTLFAGQCPPAMNEQHVRQLFRSLGPDAVEALQPVLAWDGKPKGCAFVTFRTPELAQAALRLPNPKVLGKPIALSPVRDTAEDKDSRTVRLDGCPEFVTEFNLRHHFDGLRVERVQPITNRKGEHSGIVFVRFASPQDAFQAARPGTITLGGQTMTVKRLG